MSGCYSTFLKISLENQNLYGKTAELHKSYMVKSQYCRIAPQIAFLMIAGFNQLKPVGLE